MNWITAIFNDLLNGFSANDIPVFLARVFISGLLAFLIKIIFQKKYKDTSALNNLASIAMTMAVVAPIAQFSISIGLILSAIIIGLFVNIKPKSNSELIYAVITLLASVSIGAGYVIYTLIGMAIVLVYLIISKD